MKVNEEAAVAGVMKSFLEGQVVRYLQVLALSQEQLVAVKENRTAELLDILGRKQRLIQQLDEAAADATPVLGRWEHIREALPASLRDPVRKVHERLTATMAEVIAIEDQSKAFLQEGRGISGRQMVNLQKGKQMLKAYGAVPAPVEGLFTDKRK